MRAPPTIQWNGTEFCRMGIRKVPPWPRPQPVGSTQHGFTPGYASAIFAKGWENGSPRRSQSGAIHTVQTGSRQAEKVSRPPSLMMSSHFIPDFRRFMKKPNIREASDNYSKLANALKNEENHQYAALCFSAMAK